jgi:Tfp pilus assembly protein PilP
MKKALSFSLLACFLCLSIQIAFSQQTKQETTQEEKQAIEKEISKIMPKKTRPSYSRAGRRDPFRDILAQQVAGPGPGREGEPQISVENINVIGIVQARGQFSAIVTGAQEFPLFIKVGHKFSDGFVLSIDETKVIFRKTQERGSPLFKPKDIVKEIQTEERR